MKKLFIYISFFVTGLSYAQTATENYIQSTSCLDADCIRKTETVQYFDYLGRPKQMINVKASPLGKDVVIPVEYDHLGRQVKDYLPIPQNATQNGEIYASPLSNAAAHYGSEKIFAQKVLENSPLERVQQQTHVGNDWNNKPVTYTYDANTVADGVKKYTTATIWENGATKSTLAETGVFGNGQLQKNTVTDEDGNVTIEFKNGWGQTVLLRKMLGGTKTDTYYVYNEYDKLAFVLPPLASNAPTLSLTTLDALCYQYRYDGKYNLVEKKIPGKGWEYMVYDLQNRLIMTRDANLEALGQWMFTKYDQFGRVAYTGITTGGTRSSEQTNAYNAGSNTVTRTAAVGFTHGTDVYYTNTGYPSTMSDLLSVNYYDTYPPGTPAFPTQIMGQEVLKQYGQSGAFKNTKSLPLASYLKSVEDYSYTRNYTWYDTKGRSVGSHSINHLGGYTRTEILLDFAGVPQQTKTYHKRLDTDATERIITEAFEYDHQNRLKKHWHQVNSQPQELMTENTYNELAQLSNKKVGNNLQSIDYTYNIRGWMTKINDPANLSSKLFAYEVKYQNGTAGYNGNISQVDWKTANDGVLRRYAYQYDALGRLKNAVYSEPGSFVPANNFFNETITYDLNGNITSLQRNSKGASGFAEQIDQLAYGYDNNNLSNRLNTVTDTSQNYRGYPDVSGNTITYDANGNMKTHKDKGILNIEYNYLNLPNYMMFDRTYFSRNRLQNETVYSYYRTDGVKLRKQHRYSENNLFVKKTTDYLDGFQYEALTDDVFSLKFIPTSEGYFNFENNKYIYNYTDHLGNVRLSYFKNSSNSAEVLEENNYYPFGMKHEGYNVLAGNPAYGYGYNNKELQKETGWSDYGARMYMPEIGRWGVVDPLAEKTRRWSTYVFSANNSVRFVDPDGRTWGDPKEQDNLNKFVANRISKLQKAIDKIQDQIDKGGLSDNQLSKLTTELTENRKMIGFMEQSIKDIEAIGKAPEIFYLTSPSQKDGTHSVFKKMGSDGKEKINIEGTTTAMKLHEIRHVGQSFEAGGMKFNAKGQLLNVPKKINNKLNYNANEVEAYRVGYSYDKNSFPGTAYSLEDINEESLINLSTSSSYIYGTPK